MMLSHAPSRMESNVGSDLAISDLTHANGSTDNTPAFPSVWRPGPVKKTDLPDDGISSMTNKGLPPPQEKKSDALAPRPETRRLGCFSVAALIINQMIGTGIFSTPGTVLKGTGGSKGAALFLWVLGSIATIAGLQIPISINYAGNRFSNVVSSLLIFLEFGLLLPFNGGEFIYVLLGSFLYCIGIFSDKPTFIKLRESYKKPKYLASCLFAWLFLIVGGAAPNALIFADYMITAFDPGKPNDLGKPNGPGKPNDPGKLNDPRKTNDPRLVKFIALVCITFICLMHLFSQKVGIYTSNLFALYKVTFVGFICITGFCVLGGAKVGGKKGGEPYGKQNFNGSFHRQPGTTPSTPSDYAQSLLSVLFSLGGWEASNYVLSEVKRPKGNPNTTFKKGVFWAFGLVSVLYLLANIAYFAASSAVEIEDASTKVAYKFFAKVFGQGKFTEQGLPVFLAASAFGNIVATIYASSRVDQEIARQKILPWSSYWARNSPFGTPVGALTFRWFFSAVLILATPKIAAGDGSAYNLLTNMRSYGQAWIAAAVATGLATLHLHHQWAEWRPAVLGTKRLVNILAGFYVIFNIFIIIMIWYPPAKQETINSYVAPGVSTFLIVFGIIYWIGFAKLTPLWGWKIEEVPIELADGTQWISFERHAKTGFAAWIDKRLKIRHPTPTPI